MPELTPAQVAEERRRLDEEGLVGGLLVGVVGWRAAWRRLPR